MGRLWKWLQEDICIPTVFKILAGKIEGAKKMGGYKFSWMICEKGIHGVGLLVADRRIEEVLDEENHDMRVIVGRSVLNLLSVYASESRRGREERGRVERRKNGWKRNGMKL